MSGFYVISWCTWSVWATVTLASATLAIYNFKRAQTLREWRAAIALMMIDGALIVQLIITATVPLPPDPEQLWRLFAGRGSACLIAGVVAWVALYYDREIRERSDEERRKRAREAVG